MSNYLRPYGLQHARLHSPSPFPRACSNSCPLNQKFHPTISSSVIFFSSYLESFPASGSFPTGWLFISVVKYWSFSFSISLSNEYAGLISFRIDWFDLLIDQGTLKSLPTPQVKSINSSTLSLLYGRTPTSVHDCWKNHSFDYIKP